MGGIKAASGLPNVRAIQDNSERTDIMFAKTTKQIGRTMFSRLAVCAFALCAMGAYSAAVSAQHTAGSLQSVYSHSAAISLEALERAFWLCDYAATVDGVDATPVDICSAVTDEFKNVKFGGDFLQLVKWWRENKPAEHEKLTRGEQRVAFDQAENR